MEKNMHIIRNNIVLRSAREDDVETLTSWWNDGQVMAHAGFPNGLDVSKERVLSTINLNKKNLSQLCIVEIDQERVGECNFRLEAGAAEIGIKLCDLAYQNKGYGTKVLRILIDYLFTDNVLNHENKITTIKCDTNVNNKRAQAVYQKLGFKIVRRNINSWKNQLGELQSSLDLELTFEDYLSYEQA